MLFLDGVYVGEGKFICPVSPGKSTD